MSVLSKLTIKSVTRASKQDPVQQRRRKLVAAIEEQLNVVSAAIKGERYETKRQTWVKNEHGEKVLVDRMRQVRAWFFEQDGGWYVQCKYGNKVLTLGKGNAIFVKALKDVQLVFASLREAIDVGELDETIEIAVSRRK